MTDGRGSLASPLVLVGALLAVVAVALVGAAATGAMPGMGSDAQPDGETVLDRSEQRYAAAETVVGDATVTVANGTAERSVNVSFALARPDRVRVALEDRYIAGTNGSVAWVSADGVVLSAPVPDANWSSAANRSAALADRWESLNRSALVERVLTMAEASAPAAVPGGLTERLPAGSAGDLPADWTVSDVPTNWTTGDLPTNWSDSLPADWVERIDPNWRERARAAWANRTSAWANRTDGWANRTGWNASAYGGERNYTTELVGTETVDGREAYVLSVDRAAAATPWNVTLWVDSADSRLHRVEATYRDYRLTVSLDTTINASVRDSTFRPPGDSAFALTDRAEYDTFDAAQANTSLALGRLGDGYAFANATVVTRSGVTVAVQQYTDGDRSAALVSTAGSLPFEFGEGETVTVDGETATYVERDGRSAVVWERDGVTRAVLADRPREELVALAESVTD